MRFTRLLQVLLAAGVLLGLVHVVVYQFSEPADRLYQFLYERGPVQYTIPFVACLVMVLLFERINRYRWNSRRFKALERGQGQAPKELADQLEVVSATYDKHGPTAAVARVEKVAQDHDKRIDKAHETINYIACSLPALGMFGTMLGLSKSLFVAFGSGEKGPAAVHMFVAALGTAMDTTVLGMACVVPLCGCAWLLCRFEHELGDQYSAYVQRQLDLDDVAASDKTVHVLTAELRCLTGKIAEEAKAAFEQILKDSANTYRENLEQAVETVFSLQRRHDKNMVRKVAAELAAGLGQSVHRVSDLLEQQNDRHAENMIQHVGQLEKALQNRTPEEILIRYQHNGHASKG